MPDNSDVTFPSSEWMAEHMLLPEYAMVCATTWIVGDENGLPETATPFYTFTFTMPEGPFDGPDDTWLDRTVAFTVPHDSAVRIAEAIMHHTKTGDRPDKVRYWNGQAVDGE